MPRSLQKVFWGFYCYPALWIIMNTFEYEIRSSWVSCIFFGGEPLEPTCFRFAQGTVGSQPRLLPSRCPAKHRATRGVPEHCQAWYSEKGSEKQRKNRNLWKSDLYRFIVIWEDSARVNLQTCGSTQCPSNQLRLCWDFAPTLQLLHIFEL